MAKYLKKCFLLLIVLCLFASCSILSSLRYYPSSISSNLEPKNSADDKISGDISSTSGLTAIYQKVVFGVVFSQVMFIGGYYSDIDTLKDGQSCIWQISLSNNQAKKVAKAQRACLKRLADGSSWWFLSYEMDGDIFEYEVLLDKNLVAKKLRYFNADNKRIEEALFDETEDSFVAEYPETISADWVKLKKNSSGFEKLKLESGTWDTKKLVWNVTDKNTGRSCRYSWWVSDKAPGRVVKYEYRSFSEGETFVGELVLLKNRVKTKLNSY